MMVLGAPARSGVASSPSKVGLATAPKKPHSRHTRTDLSNELKSGSPDRQRTNKQLGVIPGSIKKSRTASGDLSVLTSKKFIFQTGGNIPDQSNSPKPYEGPHWVTGSRRTQPNGHGGFSLGELRLDALLNRLADKEHYKMSQGRPKIAFASLLANQKIGNAHIGRVKTLGNEAPYKLARPATESAVKADIQMVKSRRPLSGVGSYSSSPLKLVEISLGDENYSRFLEIGRNLAEVTKTFIKTNKVDPRALSSYAQLTLDKPFSEQLDSNLRTSNCPELTCKSLKAERTILALAAKYQSSGSSDTVKIIQKCMLLSCLAFGETLGRIKTTTKKKRLLTLRRDLVLMIKQDILPLAAIFGVPIPTCKKPKQPATEDLSWSVGMEELHVAFFSESLNKILGANTITTSKSLKQVLVKSLSSGMSLYRVSQLLFLQDDGQADDGDRVLASSFCVPSMRHSSKTTSLDVGSTMQKGNINLPESGSAQKGSTLRSNSKSKLQHPVLRSGIDEESQRCVKNSDSTIESLKKPQKKKGLAKSSLLESNGPSTNTGLQTNTMKSSELLTNHAISAHHLVQLTRNQKASSPVKDTSTGGYVAELARKSNVSGDTGYILAGRSGKLGSTVKMVMGRDKNHQPPHVQEGAEECQDPNLPVKLGEQPMHQGDHQSSHEKLKGFISSVDLRLHRDFFNFQPVVHVEDLHSPCYPYLPPNSEGQYTLVLDLDETLIHFDERSRQVWLRPHVQSFLKETAEYYEVVVFTAAVQRYADWILDRLDTSDCVKHRLYRQHTKERNGAFIKDLSMLGRPLERVIMIDNNPENFQLQAENSICIKSWQGDPEDVALPLLFPLLRTIRTLGVADIRAALRSIRDKIMLLDSQ